MTSYVAIPTTYVSQPGYPATAGGRGSFSYVDTKVYGPQQGPSQWVMTRNGVLVPSGSSIVPGTGGGARAPGKRYYGSRAIGFKPDGLVLIRLMKLE